MLHVLHVLRILSRDAQVLTRLGTQVSRSDLETQSGPILVNLSGMELDPLLTEAFHDPSILASTHDVISSNNRLVISNPTSDPLAQTRGLVIGWVTTKSYLIWLILLFSVISLAIGVLVGVLIRDAELGVAVSGGAATILSCWEVFVVWHFK